MDVIIQEYNKNIEDSVESFLIENNIPYNLDTKLRIVSIYRTQITEQEAIVLTLKYPNIVIVTVNTV